MCVLVTFNLLIRKSAVVMIVLHVTCITFFVWIAMIYSFVRFRLRTFILVSLELFSRYC